MPTTGGTDRPCCGFASDQVVTFVTLVYFFVLTVLAAVARREMSVLAEASTAEGNDETLWTIPLTISLACTIVFAIFDLACIALLWLLSRYYNEPTTTLKSVWAGTVFLCVVWLTLCAVGSTLSFGDVKTGIEQACETVDTECFPTYEEIQWISIIMEVVGLFLAGWMLLSTGSRVHPSLLHKPPRANSPRSDGRAGSSSQRGRAAGDEESNLLANGGASLRSIDGATYSLGRRGKPDRRRSVPSSDPREYSLRKSRRRYDKSGDSSPDEAVQGSQRRTTRDRIDAAASREVRRVREEVDHAMRSLRHTQRRTEDNRTARKGSRLASRGRKGAGERSLGKERVGRGSGSLSRTRVRDSSSSGSDAGSSENDSLDRRRLSRSRSRGRSISRRR